MITSTTKRWKISVNLTRSYIYKCMFILYAILIISVEHDPTNVLCACNLHSATSLWKSTCMAATKIRKIFDV